MLNRKPQDANNRREASLAIAVSRQNCLTNEGFNELRIILILLVSEFITTPQRKSDRYH